MLSVISGFYSLFIKILRELGIMLFAMTFCGAIFSVFLTIIYGMVFIQNNL